MEFTKDELLDRYIEGNYTTIADSDQDTWQETNCEQMIFEENNIFYSVWITQRWGSFTKDRMSVDEVVIVKPKKVTITIWEKVTKED